MSQIQVTGEAKIRDLQGPVVANSGIVTALNGAASQYVRGDGTLADFPTVTGGGSSVSYYLNGSVNQGTFGGNTYYQFGVNAITGVGTNFSTSTNGLLAEFITDEEVPDVTEIPSGNWNIEFYMGVSASSGALASFYVEIYKYSGTTFTLLASNVATPEYLTNTTTIDAYFTSVAMPLTPMLETDRIAIRVYANVASKTVTMYTEDNRLCQVVTTFSRGILSINNLTDQQQYFAVGTAGTDFNIVSSVDTHTFNIPSASATNRGLITTGNQTLAGQKTFNSQATFDSAQTRVRELSLLGYNGSTAGALHMYQEVGASYYGGEGYTDVWANASQMIFNIRNVGALGIKAILDYSLVTDNTTKTYTFPDASGTLALTSDLGGYVPYTGATTNVDLGSYNLITSGSILSGYISALGNGIGGGYISFKTGALGGISSGYGTLGSPATGKVSIYFGDTNLYAATLSNTSLSASRTYTFPNASGTIALTSDLSGYVPTSRTISTTAPLSGGGDLSANRTLSITQSSATVNGYLSSTDWSTFNGKQNALTNPITGTGTRTANYLPIFSASNTITNSNLFTLAGTLYIPQDVQVGYDGSSGNLQARAININNDSGGGLTLFKFGVGQTNALTTDGLGVSLVINGQTSGAFSSVLINPNTGSGNVIIGSAANAGYKLDVNGTGRFTSNLEINSSAANIVVLTMSANSTGGVRQRLLNQSGSGLYNFQIGSNITTNNAFEIIPSTATDGTTFSTAVFKILNTGAATFSSSVTAGSNINLSNNTGIYIKRADGTLGQAFFLGSGNELNIGYGTADVIRFGTYLNDERMRISSGGQVCIGVTSGGYAGQTNSLTGPASSLGAATRNPNMVYWGPYSTSSGVPQYAGNWASTATWGLGPDSGTSDATLRLGGVGADSSGAYWSGLYANIKAGTYTNASDYRIKENIVGIQGALEKVLNLNPIKYNLKKAEEEHSVAELKVQVGFLAHEIQEFIPEVVYGEKDAVYADGSENHQSVDYGKLTAVLVKAIQELKQELDILKTNNI